MAEEKTLKQENLNYIRGFIIANILLFWLLAGFKFSNLMENLEASFGKIAEKLVDFAVLSVVFYIATVVICGLLNNNVKYALIFWRWKNPLPGSRVFTQLMQRDTRINTKILEERYSPLPTDPAEQNRLWYKLYKKHENEKSILEAQKHFLLTRELTSVSFLCLLILRTASYFFFSKNQLWMIYLAGLFAFFLAAAIATRNYGSRFATNVLAIESITEKPAQTKQEQTE